MSVHGYSVRHLNSGVEAAQAGVAAQQDPGAANRAETAEAAADVDCLVANVLSIIQHWTGEVAALVAQFQHCAERAQALGFWGLAAGHRERLVGERTRDRPRPLRPDSSDRRCELSVCSDKLVRRPRQARPPTEVESLPHCACWRDSGAHARRWQPRL